MRAGGGGRRSGSFMPCGRFTFAGLMEEDVSDRSCDLPASKNPINQK